MLLLFTNSKTRDNVLVFTTIKPKIEAGPYHKREP